ncbi:MAG: hypothetical protein AAF596_05365 [Planctomycetota bacterium]
MPSVRESTRSVPSSQRAAAAAIITGMSSLKSRARTTSGANNADAPRMSKMFDRLLPTTLPTARSVAPLEHDWIETASSGALVPTATTVSPITSGDTLAASARFDAPRTSTSPPTTSATSPPRMLSAMIIRWGRRPPGGESGIL